MFEMNPAAEGLRFPTRAEVEAILEAIESDQDVRAREENYSLQKRYFPARNITGTEIEIYALDNGRDRGMTYFHTLGTEPRTISRASQLGAKKTTWRGAHFKEAAIWGEEEILEIASMAPQLRPVTIQTEVAEAIAEMRLRRTRRIEWLVAQVLTTGGITVTKDMPDNPERVSYSVDYMLHDKTITLTNKFDEKDVDGKSLTNPIKFFRDLMDTARTGEYSQYVPREILVTSNFWKVLRENTLFWDTWFQYNAIETENVRERRPTWFYDDDFVKRAFHTMVPGLTVTVNDTGYYDASGEFHLFIPNNHMTIIYGEGPVGEFTFTGHVHSEGGKIRIGTGPYTFVENRLKEANPWYGVFTGFHGLPRLKSYDPRTLSSHKLKFCTYASA